MSQTWPKTVLLIACWILGFLIALRLDRTIAQHARSTGLARSIEGKWPTQVIKSPGVFWFTAAVAATLWLTRQVTPRRALFVLLAGICGGLNFFLKWVVGRSRPFKLPGVHDLRPFELHPFRGGFPGLFHQKDLSFPSGHACEAFALATAICIVWPRGKGPFIGLAILVGLERIAENAHYTSDVVAGAGLSILCVTLLNRWIGNWMRSGGPEGFAVITGPTESAVAPMDQSESNFLNSSMQNVRRAFSRPYIGINNKSGIYFRTDPM